MSQINQDAQDANQKPLETLEGITLPSGNYRLLKRIASTNMSVVYHAYDNATKRAVAVKILANDRYAARFQNRREGIADGWRAAIRHWLLRASSTDPAAR